MQYSTSAASQVVSRRNRLLISECFHSFPHSFKDVPSHASTDQKMTSLMNEGNISAGRRGSPQSGHSAGWWVSGERIWEITHFYEKLNLFLIIYHFWIMECWCHSYCGSYCKRPPIRSSFGLFFSPLISPLSLGRLYIPSLHEFTNDIKVICGLFASHFICKCMLIYVNKSKKWLILGNFNPECHLSSLKESPYDSLCFCIWKDSTEIIT